MKLSRFLPSLLAFVSLWLPISALANWNDPTIVCQQTSVVPGQAFEVDYYNAPEGAVIALYPAKGTIANAVESISLSSTKGTVKITPPASEGNRIYLLAMFTGDKSTVLTETVTVMSNTSEEETSIATDKIGYSRSATITIDYKNTLGAADDKIVAYPFSTPVLPTTDPKYTAPSASASISGTSGTTTMKIATAGYYSIYYLPEGYHGTPVKSADIIVGTPASISVGIKYSPEDNIEVTATNLSEKYTDWVGVFPFLCNIQTETPLYRIDLKGQTKSSVSIPAGTLPIGIYKVCLFYNNSRVTSAISSKVTIDLGEESLQYSDEEAITYYNIICPTDNKGMTSENESSISSSVRSMKLLTFTEQNEKAQWKLVKRENGKVDIINRATGEYLLSRSALQNGMNITKLGVTDSTNNGFSFTHLSDNQFAISSIEEDGVLRYLGNLPLGSETEPLVLKANTKFAWQMIPVETVVTSIKNVSSKGETIKVINGKIKVDGNQNYHVYNAEGSEMPKNSHLTPGVYLLKWKDGRNAKTIVK